MSQSFTCPRGHQWEVSEDLSQSTAASRVCPVCSTPSVNPPPPQESLAGLRSLQQLFAPPATDSGPQPPTPGFLAVPPWRGPEASGTASDLPCVAGYELLSVLGRGGMGVVYRARQLLLNRIVALKMVLAGSHADAAELTRFRREAEAVARLQHPNIVQVHEVGEADGQPFFSLEFVDGSTLAERLKGTPLPARQAAQLVETLARAMHAAHQRGLLHRDLKPANVLLTTDGTPKITDFGLAKRLDEEPGAAGLTQTGAIMGTPSYMAPEQARGENAQVGPSADIYALGALLYECLTGRPPFRAESLLETLLQVRGQEPVPPRQLQPKLPRDLETICLKCLQKAPVRRYATAADLAEDLRRFQAGETIQARPVGTVEKAIKWARRRPAGAALLGALGLGLVLLSGGGVWLRQYYIDLRQGTEAALATAAELRDATRWQAAHAILAQAEARLGSRGPTDLQQRVAQVRASVQLAERLDDIRLQRATRFVEGGAFDNGSADQDYAAAFREACLAAEEDEAATVAARIRDRQLGPQVIAALDDWASVTADLRRREWLRKVARQVEGETEHDRFRDPKVWRDPVAMQALANALLQDERQLGQLKPQLLAMLGLALLATQGDAVSFLTAAQAHHPNDFWLNLHLGKALGLAKQWERAVGYFRAALAIRPDASAVHDNLGTALKARGQTDEALREFHLALALDPRNALAHNNLGVALMDKGQLEEAIREYRSALDLDPRLARAHYNLGLIAQRKHQLEEAQREYRTAIDLNPHYALAHNNLGNVLQAKGQLDEGIRELRAALASDPKSAMIRNNLGFALKNKGQLDEAIQELHAALELDPHYAFAHNNLGNALRAKGQLADAVQAYRAALASDPTYGTARTNLLQTERLAQVAPRLAPILEGKAQPADAAERLALARLCLEPFHHRFAAAARFYSEAFMADPKLDDDSRVGDRYDAACAAALAAGGQGVDTATLTDAERARLRQQAQDWLRADLAFWAQQLGKDLPKERERVQRTLTHWQSDTDLANVREPLELAKLPDAEREDWRRLWKEVAAVRTKARAPK